MAYQFVRALGSDIVHVLTRFTRDSERKYRNLAVTACNRKLKHYHTQKSVGFGNRACPRCGNELDFEAVREALLHHDAEERRQRMNAEAMRDAEAVAEGSWYALGKSLDEGIMDEIGKLVDAGNVFIPFSKSGLAFLRTILRRYIAHVEKLETKSEETVSLWYRAVDMLEHLDAYGN